MAWACVASALLLARALRYGAELLPMTSVISWFSITITKTWLKLGRRAEGVGVGLGVGDGLGLGVGVGDGVGDGDGDGLGVGEGDGDGLGVGVGGGGLPAWQLAAMPSRQAGLGGAW